MQLDVTNADQIESAFHQTYEIVGDSGNLKFIIVIVPCSRYCCCGGGCSSRNNRNMTVQVDSKLITDYVIRFMGLS